MKLCLVTSAGGHLYQLWQLSPCWKNNKRFWVSFAKPDVHSLLKKEKVYYAIYPESRHLLNGIRNFFLAIKILAKEKPRIVLSAGAGVAPPFFLAAKLMGIYTIYIEPVDFMVQPSLTGKIVYKLVNLFLVQNPRQLKFFPRASYWGSTL